MSLGPLARWHVETGDCRAALDAIEPESIDCCVTSPSYYRLRDYGHPSQIGLEQTPDAYVAELVSVFRQVRRCLKPAGTLWLNLGDSYVGGGGGGQGKNGQRASRKTHRLPAKSGPGLKYKDLIGIPWRVALALQADGWWLRSDCIWSKPNPLPASMLDRPTTSHEYVFLLAASEVYYYDAAAVRETARTKKSGNKERVFADGTGGHLPTHVGRSFPWESQDGKRNRRSVWTISTVPSDGDHPAPMPPDLAEPCIMAGCPAGGLVLDPFCGKGTVGTTALRLGRRFYGIEIVPRHAARARRDLAGDAPLLDLEAER